MAIELDKDPGKKNWSRRPPNHVPLNVSRMVRFTQKDSDLLKRAAREKGISVNGFIRLAIFEYLKKEGYERT